MRNVSCECVIYSARRPDVVDTAYMSHDRAERQANGENGPGEGSGSGTPSPVDKPSASLSGGAVPDVDLTTLSEGWSTRANAIHAFRSTDGLMMSFSRS